MIIRAGGLDHPQVLDLLQEHLAGMHASSPPESVFALDLSGLKSPAVSFWTVWHDETLLGFGALKELDATSGEIKSMRTAVAHLRKGVARALLEHVIAVARSRGYTRLCLETGSSPAFEPALALYRRHGFVNGEAFADYRKSDFNQFLHLDLHRHGS